MAKLQLIFFLIGAIILPEIFGDAVSVRFHNCKSTFNVKEVKVDPCPGGDTQRCPLKKGTSPTVSVTFIPDKEVRNLTASVHGIIATIPTEFPLPNKNACSNSGLTCPLQANQEYTYTQKVPVLASYPNIQLLIRWSLDDKQDQAVAEGEEKKPNVCFIIRAQVVD